MDQTRIDRLYTKLLLQTQDLPQEESLPLTVAGRLAGWITPKALDALKNEDGLRIKRDAVHIADPGSSKSELDPLLAHYAQVLKAAGCIRSWRNELLSVVAEGYGLAVIERGTMRPLGLLTTAVHLNGWSPDGRLYVSKRAPTKSTDPNMWDTLVGGLANGIESFDDALVRESDEEAGLSPEEVTRRTPLRTITRMHRRLPEGYQVEDVLISDCLIPEHVTPRNKDGEVSEICLLRPQEVITMIEDGVVTIEAALVILESILYHRKNEIA